MLQVFSRDLEPMAYGLWRPLLRQLDEMFETQTASQSQPRDQWSQERPAFSPSYDLHETDQHYLVNFDIPGVQRDDLNIELTGNRLVVSGERRAEGKGARERYGKFQHVFTLPDGVTADGLVAEHKDGVLRLSIPKPSTVRATKIRIADGTGKNGFLKNLIGEKKAKDASETKAPSEDSESVAMKN